MPCPKNSLGYSFIIKGKVLGWGEGPSFSFLSRCHVSIISSSPRSGREVYLPLYGQARTVIQHFGKIFSVFSTMRVF